MTGTSLFQFNSILSRIVFLHIVAVLITAICMPLVIHRFLNSDVDRLQQSALRQQAEELALHLSARDDDGWSFDPPQGVKDQYSAAYGRYTYVLLGDAGQVLFSSSNENRPLSAVRATGPSVQFFEAHLDDKTISGASLRKQIEDRGVWIQVAENLAHRDALIDDVVANFLWNVGWVTIPILLALLASDVLIFRRAVEPLLRASVRAAHIRPSRMDVRLPVDDMPQEIRPLVVAINHALERLEVGFRRQGEFAADVAHELRTPLAVLRIRIDTLPDQSAAKELRKDVEWMSRVIGQLLDAAELETFLVDPGGAADLSSVSLAVAESMAPLALTQRKAIALTGAHTPVWVRGNGEMLRLALRNLVENAVNHTPEDTEVEIVVGEAGIVSVLDRGTGVSVENTNQIFKRFWRRDQQMAGGAGLGLSIAKRIADAYGGTIRVQNRPGSGADFSMQFVPTDGTQS